VSADPGPVSSREGQLRSGFTGILEALCESSVGALAAALVDEEGESVDLACNTGTDGAAAIPSYVVKLTAAHLQIVTRDIAASAAFGGVRQLRVATDQRGYLVLALPRGYVVVLVCESTGLEGVSWRALRQCEIDLCREAGWEPPRLGLSEWRRVRVRVGRDGVPRRVRLEAGWSSALQAIGPLAGTAARERGFRLRTEEGAELGLVREPSGHWYAERLPEAALRVDRGAP